MFRGLLFAVILILFSSCEDKETPLFKMNFESEFAIQAGLNTIETHYIIIQDVSSLIESYKATFNVTDEEISSILPSRATMSQIFSNYPYDYIDKISFWAVSNIDPTLRKEMFYMDFVPLNQDDELQMISSISNLKDIMLEGSFDLEVKLNFRSFPINQTDNIITFSLVANAL